MSLEEKREIKQATEGWLPQKNQETRRDSRAGAR
jgi:hypothetical protein